MLSKQLQKKKEQFSKLWKKEKIDIVKKMLSIIKWWWDIFDDLYELIDVLWEDVSNSLLLSIYTSIRTAVENINMQKLNKEVENIKKIKDKVNKLKELEEMKKNEENPEDLLENI